MYPISDVLRLRFERGEKKSIKITSGSATASDLLITEADIVSNSFSIDRYCVTGNKIEVGSAVAAELSLTLNNTDGKFNKYTFEGVELFVEIGIAGVAESYIPCGKFTVDEPPRDNMRISLKALDFMMLFDKAADLSKIPFPCTPGEIITKACELCGVTLSSSVDFSKLPNCEEGFYAPTTAVTYRQLLQWACEILGVCAYMDHNGELMLSWYTDTDTNLTPALRYSGNVFENDIGISGVTVKAQNVSATAGTEEYPIVIEGNELIYAYGDEETLASRAESISAGIKNSVGDFKYRPYECSCMPMPYLYPLDKITYTDKNGNVISTVITNHTFGLNSVSNLSAQGETAQQGGWSKTRGISKKEIDAIIADALRNIDTTAERLYVRYSAYPDGMNNGATSMTQDVQSDTLYIGTCVTTANEAPKEASSYTWLKIRGEDGQDGQDGQDGNDGKGVSKVETWYCLSTSETALVGGSWSTSAPTWTDGTYLWTKLVTTYTDGDTEESDPVVDASWKKTSAVEKASGELNEALANALGLHITDLTVSGSKIRYYHTNPVLSASVEGDTILVLNASGFGVCTSGWNSGNPKFAYGATFDGKAVWDILVANKISADLIEAGVIKSLDTAGVHTTLNLDTGILRFDSSGTVISVEGFPEKKESETDAEYAEANKSPSRMPGIKMLWAEQDSAAYYSPSHIYMVSPTYLSETMEYAMALFKWLSDKTQPMPVRPEPQPQVMISRALIFGTNIQCEKLSFSNSEGNILMADAYAEISSLKKSLATLQEKYTALEEALGQVHEHTAKTAVKENVVEATCETAGSYDSVVYCATCGEEISREEITVEALGHNYTSVVTPPTATEQGYTTHTCSRCGDSYVDSYTDPTGSETTESMTVKLTNGSNSASEGDSFYFSNNNQGTDILGTNKVFNKGDGYVWVVAKPGTGRKLVRLEAYVNGELADSQTLDQTSIWATTIMYMADYAGKTVEYKMYFSGAGTSTFIVSKGGDTTSADSVQIFDSSYNSIGTTAEVSYGESIHIEGGTVSGRQITSIEVVVDGVSSGTISSSDLISVGYLTSSRTTVAMPVNFTDPNWAGTTREYIIYFATA